MPTIANTPTRRERLNEVIAKRTVKAVSGLSDRKLRALASLAIMAARAAPAEQRALLDNIRRIADDL